MKPLITKIFAIVFLGGMLVLPMRTVFAAELDASAHLKEAGIGQEIAIDIFLNTDGKSVNALSGDIVISFLPSASSTAGAFKGSPEFTVTHIHDGDSIVGAWLTKANSNDPAHVSFSGIIPGGTTTAHGKVLTLYLVPKRIGTLTLSTTGTLFENDTRGVSQALRPSSMSLAVAVLPPLQSGATTTPEIKDTTSPIEIKAIIAQNAEMFDGKPFIIVNAKDTESGIATYELLETTVRYSTDALLHDTGLPWRRIDNPAPLTAPLTAGFIYLRVTDRENNAAVVEVSHPVQLSPGNTSWLFSEWFISAILIVIAALILWLLYRRGRKHHG